MFKAIKEVDEIVSASIGISSGLGVMVSIINIGSIKEP